MCSPETSPTPSQTKAPAPFEEEREVFGAHRRWLAPGAVFAEELLGHAERELREPESLLVTG